MQIPAANPTMHTTAPTLTEPSGNAVSTDNATALTTVVVTILEEKLVSTTAHVMKNNINPITGRLLVSGSSVPVSHVLMPMSSLVRHAPNWVAAAVISTLPHNTPLLATSRKFIIRSPSTWKIKSSTQPNSGGIAVDQLFTIVYTSGRSPLIRLGATQSKTVRNMTPRIIFSFRSAAGTVPRRFIAFSGRISPTSSGR